MVLWNAEDWTVIERIRRGLRGGLVTGSEDGAITTYAPIVRRRRKIPIVPGQIVGTEQMPRECSIACSTGGCSD